ncbi:COG4223 family protein [Phaeobacter porticola]|uniref:Inner membrane protein n=1 Tax=Phaeobacter porticola TaxID=1844006 RepID=A0A1L3I9F1_9RHOB|nr:hypothetical protein [Phaeobacter porticola]APG48748.1 hypothetical protein PhaeoP97_03395 [Phaeobacter porticola]
MADKKKSDEILADNNQMSVSDQDIDADAILEEGHSAPEGTEDNQIPDANVVDAGNIEGADLNAAPSAEPVGTELNASDDVMDDLSDTHSSHLQDTVQTPDGPVLAPTPEVERVIEKRGGFGAALLGGFVAAGLGFVAGQSNLLDDVLPPSWRAAPAVDSAALEAVQQRLYGRITELESRTTEARATSLETVETRMETLAQDIVDLQSAEPSTADAGLVDMLDGLTARMEALENRPITDGASPAATAAFEAELTKLQDSLAAQRVEVEKMVAEARDMEAASAEAARIAGAQSIVARMRSAIDAGSSFGGMIEELAAMEVAAPSALTGSAEAGVRTLSSLRDGFAPAAREALAAARQETKGSGGIAAYIQRQLGARSVEIRDGDDPDAVLSRAEAAVDSGDLQAAMAELDALPKTARMPLSDWEAAARARLAAVSAVNELAQSLNAK